MPSRTSPRRRRSTRRSACCSRTQVRGRRLGARSGQPRRDLHVRPDPRRPRGRRAAAPRQGGPATRARADGRDVRAGGRPGRRARGAAGNGRGRRHRLARRGDVARRDRLPHEPRGGGRAARRIPRRRGDRVRPAALERRRRGDAPHDVHLAARSRPGARLPADRPDPADVAPGRAWHRRSSGCPTRSSRRRARTSSRSARAARSRSRGTTRRVAGWSGPVSTSSPTAATRSRARATAARPA